MKKPDPLKKDRDKDAVRQGDMPAGHFREKNIFYV